MTIDTIRPLLREHLESFGICHFEGEEYWSWGGEALGMRVGMQLNRLREPLVDGAATPKQYRRFYDFIAEPRIAAVVHSMKADAILQSGSYIESQLMVDEAVLDVGCSIGYLTLFYALRSEARSVVGWDWSRRSIEIAREQARKRGVGNVTFEQHDIAVAKADRTFDVVCSTQTLGTPEVGPQALARAAASLRSGGRLICVEPLADVEQATTFLQSAASVNLALQQHEFVYFSDLGERGAYPAFVFQKGGEAVPIDLAASYRRVLDVLAG